MPPSLQRRLVRRGRGGRRNPEVPSLLAVAVGERDGRRLRVGAGTVALPPGGMAGMTGTPVAVGLELLLDGRLVRPGVWAPEDVVDPDAFFTALAPHCAGAQTDLTAVVDVREESAE